MTEEKKIPVIEVLNNSIYQDSKEKRFMMLGRWLIWKIKKKKFNHLNVVKWIKSTCHWRNTNCRKGQTDSVKWLEFKLRQFNLFYIDKYVLDIFGRELQLLVNFKTVAKGGTCGIMTTAVEKGTSKPNSN